MTTQSVARIKAPVINLDYLSFLEIFFIALISKSFNYYLKQYNFDIYKKLKTITMVTGSIIALRRRHTF